MVKNSVWHKLVFHFLQLIERGVTMMTKKKLVTRSRSEVDQVAVEVAIHTRQQRKGNAEIILAIAAVPSTKNLTPQSNPPHMHTIRIIFKILQIISNAVAI